MTSSPLERATHEFATHVAQWRTHRGLSKRALAAEMGFDPSYVSHVEGRRHRPTKDFARRAEGVLRTGGVIWKSYAAYQALRQSPAPVAPPIDSDLWLPPGTGLVIEREQAALALDADRYHIQIRRDLYNAGTDPVVRIPILIQVDRYPADPPRSARLHRGAPLTWSELGFFGRVRAGFGDVETMTSRVSHESDAAKELWLHFENSDGRFPLYPGERATVEYGYHVTTVKWGTWFQRAVRLPTRELSVNLDFPATTDPAVWGTVSSLSADAAPLDSPIRATTDGERTSFTWSVRSPVLQARFRFEWRFRQPTRAG